jgi:plastocyanin
MTRTALVFILLLAGISGPTLAQSGGSATLVVRDHRFEPAELTVPAGQKIELQVTNADSTPAEFESGELRREKLLPPGKTVTIYVGPLRPGQYEFFDDFHPSTRGHLVAR